MNALILAGLIALSPAEPSLPPMPDYPSYITNSDGSRMACSPGGYSCWPDRSGLPPSLNTP